MKKIYVVPPQEVLMWLDMLKDKQMSYKALVLHQVLTWAIGQTCKNECYEWVFGRMEWACYQIFTEHLSLDLLLHYDDTRNRKQIPHDLSEQSCEQSWDSSENRYILGCWKKYFESKLEKQDSQKKKHDLDIGLRVEGRMDVTVSQKALFY